MLAFFGAMMREPRRVRAVEAGLWGRRLAVRRGDEQEDVLFGFGTETAAAAGFFYLSLGHGCGGLELGF